jgi:hypothetical protein
VLLHEGWSVSNFGITVPAQIGKNQPESGFERRGHRIPKFVIRRKGMEQNNRRAVPANFITDLGVVAAHTFHGSDYMSRGFNGEPGVPARPPHC